MRLTISLSSEPSSVVGFHAERQRGVIGVHAGLELRQEVLDLIDRDGVADAGVDPAALLERAAAVDADQFALHVEQRAAGVAGVDRRVDLDAVGVFQQRAGRILIAMHAADQAERHGGREVGGQQERIAHRQRPIAGLHLVAVAQLGVGELVARLLGQQLDEGHVADLVEADQDGIVKHGRRADRTS